MSAVAADRPAEGSSISHSLSIPTFTREKSQAASFSPADTNNVRSGVNILKQQRREEPHSSCSDGDTEGCFPQSQLSTADANVSAEREQGNHETSNQERKLDPSLALVRLNTPPDRSTLVFKAEAEAQGEVIEEVVPVLHRAQSLPGANNAIIDIDSAAPLFHSLPNPCSLDAVESSANYGPLDCLFGFQVSGLGPTGNDENTTVIENPVFKQIQESAAMGGGRESLHKLLSMHQEEPVALRKPDPRVCEETNLVDEPPALVGRSFRRQLPRNAIAGASNGLDRGKNELVIITAGSTVISDSLVVAAPSFLTPPYRQCLVINRGPRRPIQCTDWTIVLETIRRSTVGCFHKFRDIEYYKSAGPMEFIYYTIEGIFGIDFSQMKWLSRGGNASVYCGGPEDRYAIKMTKYRKEELNISYQLRHPNVMKLLGVVLIGPTQHRMCCHIMYKMTCDLNRALSTFHPYGLLKHLSSDHIQQHYSLCNAVYILQCALMSLLYLKSIGIQHGDIKERNILLRMKCSCSCVFYCKCPKNSEFKYAVRIADFDCVRKISEDRWTGGGTMTYRAPEQGVRRDDGVDHGGTYSDIWSVGVIGLYMLLGRGTPDERRQFRKEANIIVRQPHCSDLNARSEVTYVRLMLTKLQECPAVNTPKALLDAQECPAVNTPKALLECPAGNNTPKALLEAREVPAGNTPKALVTVIAKCLEVDYEKRLGPQELLQLLDAGYL